MLWKRQRHPAKAAGQLWLAQCVVNKVAEVFLHHFLGVWAGYHIVALFAEIRVGCRGRAKAQTNFFKYGAAGDAAGRSKRPKDDGVFLVLCNFLCNGYRLFGFVFVVVPVNLQLHAVHAAVCIDFIYRVLVGCFVTFTILCAIAGKGALIGSFVYGSGCLRTWTATALLALAARSRRLAAIGTSCKGHDHHCQAQGQSQKFSTLFSLKHCLLAIVSWCNHSTGCFGEIQSPNATKMNIQFCSIRCKSQFNRQYILKKYILFIYISIYNSLSFQNRTFKW